VRQPLAPKEGWAPDASSEAAQAQPLRCGSDVTDRLRPELYKQIPPATGTIIAHLTGRVIWDRYKPSCCKQPQPSNTSLGAWCKRPRVHLLLGLGFEEVGDLGRGFADGVHVAIYQRRGARER
jgi:hypothetical protein